MNRNKYALVFLLIFYTLNFSYEQITIKKELIFESNSTESVRWMEESVDSLFIMGMSDSKEGNGNNDFLLLKTDLFGKVLWKRFYGGNEDDRGYVVRELNDGLILAGAMLSKTYGDLKTNGGWDGLVIKTDKAGNVIWKQNYGKNRGETIRDIIKTNDNGSIFCGYTFSYDYETHHGGKDFWIVKTDHKGDVKWEKVLGGSNYDMAYSVIQTSDNQYVIAGYSFSKDGDLDGKENHGGGDYWIVKLDYYGNVVWSKLYGGSGWEEVRQVIETRDRGLLLAGVASSKDGDVKSGKGFWDAWLVKLDRNGNLEWEKTYGGSSYDKAFSVQELSDRGFVVAGMTKSNDGDVEKHYGDSDVWVFRTDRYGKLIWEHTIGGKESENAEKVLRLKDGRYAVAWGEFFGRESFAGDDGRRYEDYRVTLFHAK